MNEKRIMPRRGLKRSARIEFSDGTTFDCSLIDVSQTGARLFMPNAPVVPEEFVLVLRDDLRRQCRAIRRSELSLGVMFITQSTATN